MASRRPPPQSFGWSGSTRPRDIRVVAETPKEEARGNIRWNAGKGPEASRQPSRTIPQPTSSSRLPHAPAYRRPSDSQPEQPRFVRHSRIPSSIGSANGSAVGSTDGTPSSTTASSRLTGPGLKPRNVLRRKRSGLSQDAGNDRNNSNGTSSSDSNPRSQTPLDPLHLDRELTQSPMEIRIAHHVEIPTTKAQTVTIYPELDRYRDYIPPAQFDSPGLNLPYRLATHDLPPPTPLFSGTSSQVSAFSGSPSTRWSESPGPGPYSRDTTPTSISSQSPGLVVPIRIPPPGSRIRQADPSLTRPPVTRRRAGSISNEVGSVVSPDPQGLSVVRELSTSSSSNSTVRAGGNTKEKKSKRAPSPPPRKSSQKPKESRDAVISPPRPARKMAQPGTTSPPPKISSYSRPRPVQRPPITASPKPVPVQRPQTTASPKLNPPVRPSRDGTANLQPSRIIPIVHSNLSSTSLSERRQSGLMAPGQLGRTAVSSTAPDRSGYLTQRPPAREPTPAPKPSTSVDVMSTSGTTRPARTPSPSVSIFKSRFPLFGRRTKTVPEPTQQDKKEKPARKGPAAGTGHEGYGRLGHIRRKSNTTRVIPGTMSSQESLGTYDPFFAQRMAPVIIAGGEVVENRNTSSELTRTESNQSSAFRRPSIESRNSSQVSLSANHEEQRKTLWPSPFPRGHARTASSSSRQLSESSDNEALAMKPTLALRRSIQRLQSGGQEPPRLPKPIVTRAQVVSPAMTSFDTTIMSDDSMFDPSAAQAVATKETDATTTSGPKRLLRRARSPHKWNIFGRSHKQPVVEKKEDTSRTVAATVKVVQSKPVAFYTMMDSSEDSGPVDLEELLSEARGIAISTPEPDLVVEPESRRPSLAENRRPSVGDSRRPSVAESRRPSAVEMRRPSLTEPSAAPSPPRPQHAEQQRPAIPQQAVTAPVTLPIPLAPEPKLAPKPERAPAQQHVQQVPVPRHAPARPSRLPQVGRIPKVVSARAEHISPKSFSRPFHRLSVHLAPVRPNVQDEESVAKGPSPTKPSTPEPLYEEPLPADESHFAALVYGVPRLSPPPISPPRREFLSFSPRKDSQGTTTTCSSSSGGINSYAVATAVVPEPNAPLAEDEIWDEYNDLLGEETMRFSKAEVPSWPKPLRLEGSAKARVKLIPPPLESPTLSPPPLPSLVATLRAGMEHTSLSVRGSDVALEVKRMLDYGPTPETSMVFRDSVCSQDEKAQTVDASKQPEEPVPAQRNSCSSVHQTRRSDASGSTQGSEDSSPLAQVNLRVGSMTVSKWLTFGHVLFSPVRDELISDVGSLKRPSILVVDGLGNDDWSFYAAETYPAATFFNLSPRAPLPAEHRNETSFPLSPPNHHQVQYLSHTAKFPFGAQSFTAVVFRFPVAAPEGHYRNIISEARRVLKPGGYIELSILDADLNNMGNRCRRTVRRLKERIHATAPDTSLASTSDLILRLIGRRGFQDVKTCRVGVPVASAIARTSSSGGSRDSVGKRNSVTASGLPKQDKKLKAKRDDRSLPEMINDESPVADASIAQSVARVGRWWYSRCYESPVVTMAPGAEPSTLGASIWRDKALLAECQAWGTSLKLMVCHARVPDGRARVASI